MCMMRFILIFIVSIFKLIAGCTRWSCFLAGFGFCRRNMGWLFGADCPMLPGSRTLWHREIYTLQRLIFQADLLPPPGCSCLPFSNSSTSFEDLDCIVEENLQDILHAWTFLIEFSFHCNKFNLTYSHACNSMLYM